MTGMGEHEWHTARAALPKPKPLTRDVGDAHHRGNGGHRVPHHTRAIQARVLPNHVRRQEPAVGAAYDADAGGV